MQTSRSLGILLVVPILVATTWWLLGGSGDEAPELGPKDDIVASSTGGAVRSAGQFGAEATSETGEHRTAVAASETTPLTATGLSIVGQIVDDTGKPIAGAAVQCIPQQDYENADPAEFESMDPQVWIDRARAMHAQRVEGKSGEDGRFTLPVPGKSPYVELRARMRGHVVAAQNVKRPVEKDLDVGAVTLKRGSIVAGRVVDRAGKAVVKARVTRTGVGEGSGWFDGNYPGYEEMEALNDNGDLATTDDEGGFELAHVAPGKFALRARHVDHPVARLEGLEANPGASVADLVIVVEPGASIRGKLLGAPANGKGLRVQAAPTRSNDGSRQPAEANFAFAMADGEIVSNFESPFGERNAEVAPDGSFALRGLTVGKSYSVWATQNGRGFTGMAPCSQRVDVASGTSGVELRYELGVTVTFTVIDAVTKAPLDRLWISDRLATAGNPRDGMDFSPSSARMREYPDGRVTLANLRPKPKQRLTLGVEALAHARFSRDAIELPAVGTIDLGVIELAPAPVLQVLVTAADGTPVAGATVRIVEQRDSRDGQQRAQIEHMMAMQAAAARNARTDGEGRAILNSLPGKRVILSATHREYAAWESDAFVCPERGDSERPVQLLRGGTVEVSVVETDGQPVANARVERRDPRGGQDSQRTDKNGVATFERLRPGEHWFGLRQRDQMVYGELMGDVVVSRPTGAPPQQPKGSQKLEVADGSKATLSITKPPSAKLAGMVRENGQPLAGARISFQQGLGDESPEAAARARIAARMGEDFGVGPSTRSGEDGRYRLAELVAGEHRLRITHKDRVMPAVVRVVLRDGENNLDIDLDTTILRGTVTDETGKPVASASITVANAGGAAAPADVQGGFVVREFAGVGGPIEMGGNQGRRTRSDANGRYELRGVDPSAPLVVRATKKGLAPGSSAPVQAPRGSMTDGIDVTMRAAGTVVVRAANAAGPAMARATWDGPETDGVEPVTQMFRNGVATFDSLRTGRWKIVLERSGQPSEPRVVDVTAGASVDVAF
ncbi:MAG: carboxypeptidase regulatory-like domain-containing protein [Planctomycetes bacterium]|nr:carboxypeptidase regulatory-like domain-containing protein [Planctomycetota bacterium]